MKSVIIATKNQGKAKEFQQMFGRYGVEVKTLLDYPDFPDIEETGSTFEENAILKAEALSKELHVPVIADDSGLEIDSLEGRPGVYSARYAGEEKNDEANLEKVLSELNGLSPAERTARFKCVLAVALPGKNTETFFGSCEGRILDEKRGKNGFGYDPIFFVEEYGQTMAELPAETKNKISHRAEALKKLQARLENLMKGEER
ncbi:MAG TPA: XTP/dITP diphosphatase [Chondromyces sp.]|nr:XTP/dITP diphosphatase [Chondromyces sp.]